MNLILKELLQELLLRVKLEVLIMWFTLMIDMDTLLSIALHSSKARGLVLVLCEVVGPNYKLGEDVVFYLLYCVEHPGVVGWIS